jgi:Glycosyltransferase family 87
MRNSPSTLKSALWLITAVICATSMQFYTAKIWSVGQPTRFSDLYAPWWGSHEVLVHGRNPYTPAVAHEIQTFIYGAPVSLGASGDPDDLSGGFAYPLYVAFLLWPAVHLPFALVQSLFTWIAAALTLGSILLWLRALQFRGSLLEWFTIVLFALGNFPVLQGIHLQNLSLVAAALLTFSLVLLSKEYLTLAGFVLAASTFKPQFTVVVLPWLALWTLSRWRQRQRLAWSFLASMCVLMGVSELLLPGWLRDFIQVVRAYTHYTFGRSLLDLWFTPHAGSFASAGLLLAVLVLCWKFRHVGGQAPHLFLVVGIMLAATITVIPTLAPHTQLLLLPGLLCLYHYRSILWSSHRFARLALVALCLLLAWPWLAAIILALASPLFSTNEVLHWWELPLYTSPVLPLAVLVTLCCLIRIPLIAGNTDLHSPR